MTDTKQELYTTEPFEKDGVKGTIIKSPEGNPLFSLNESFTEEQINVVFRLCDAFFKNGVEVAILQHQNNFRNLIGLNGLTQENLNQLLEGLKES